MKKRYFVLAGVVMGFTFSSVSAAPLQYWAENNFIQIADMDGKFVQGGHLSPSERTSDSQKNNFDAKYLYYKFDNESKKLSLGLQAGFNLIGGTEAWNGGTVTAGDLAFSFTPHVDSSKQALKFYNYGAYFGLTQVGYKNYKKRGINNPKSWFKEDRKAGVYKANETGAGSWSTDTAYPATAYAIDLRGSSANQFVTGFKNNLVGVFSDRKDYGRVVSFDLTKMVDDAAVQAFLQGGSDLKIHTFWTMGCGNDNVWGQSTIQGSGGSEVPEPSTFALLGLGGLAFGFYRRKKN